MTFKTRWCITGTLTTRTALHIGAGTTTEYEALKKENKEDNEAIQISAIALDAQGKPYIPGSTLKGNLRAWLQPRVKEKNFLDAVFGKGRKSEENEELEEQGGKANFWNALIQKTLETPQYPPPYWHSERQVGIEVGVTINRVTRTAREKKLFHREIVPPELVFQVRITGQGLNEEEIALLLAGLNGFNDKQQPISLGSDNAQNKGQMDWQLDKIERVDKEATKKWLSQGAPGIWNQALQVLNSSEIQVLQQNSQTLLEEAGNPPILQLHLQLQFDSPFLVNDPSLEVKNDPNSPNHQPRRDHHGKAVLPSSALRGAIRAQAERIIRTLNPKNPNHAACLIDNEQQACKPIEAYKDVEKLCLACQIFGASGWLSPIHISDFTLVKDIKPELTQEFVAIDRFTGGGAEHLKFKTRAVYKPTFTGTWQIDLQRCKPWGLGLLALVIRDIIEGDITFGFGAAKGYGHCEAKLLDWLINALPDETDYPEWKAIKEEVTKKGLNPETPQQWQDSEAVRDFINDLVVLFQEKTFKVSKTLKV